MSQQVFQERATNFYKYLLEYKQLNRKSIRSLHEVEASNYFYLDELFLESEDVTMKAIEEIVLEEEIVRLKKPHVEKCPSPPPVLWNWLNVSSQSDIHDLTRKEIPHLRQKLSVDSSGVDRAEVFDESHPLFAVYEAWHQRRKDWYEENVIKARVEKLFEKVYRIMNDLKKEEDTLEFTLANGILTDSTDRSIQYPLLFTRVAITFEARTNELSIRQTEAPIQFNETLLNELVDVNHSIVGKMGAALRDEPPHLLDQEAMEETLSKLVHSLTPDSQYVAEPSEKRSNVRLHIFNRPIFLLKPQGDQSTHVLQEIVRMTEEGKDVPKPIRQMLGEEFPSRTTDPERTVEEHLAATSGESLEVLLCKDANHEQLNIANKIEQYDALVVQGPPGTGKTHTIANLIGHFLAQGKSILVTSHTRKALSVLKDKLPEPLQHLCVALTDDKNEDMERAINGIQQRLSQDTVDSYRKKERAYEEERHLIFQEQSKKRRQLFAMLNEETASIVYDGEGYRPIDMAKYVREREELLTLIPGEVKENIPYPLTGQETIELYESNGKMSQAVEAEMAMDLPHPTQFISSEKVKRSVMLEDELHQFIERSKIALELVEWNGRVVIREKETNVVRLDATAESFSSVSTMEAQPNWIKRVLFDMYIGGGMHKRWEEFCHLLQQTYEAADQLSSKLLLDVQVSVEDDEALRESLQQLQSELQKEPGFFARLFGSKSKLAKEHVLINGKPLDHAEQVDDVILYLDYKQLAHQLHRVWKQLMVPSGEPSYDRLDVEEGVKMKPYVTSLSDLLENSDRLKDELARLEAVGIHHGLSILWDDAHKTEENFERLYAFITEEAHEWLQAGASLVAYNDIRAEEEQTMELLRDPKYRASNMIRIVRDALVAKRVADYEQGLAIATSIYESRQSHHRRVELIQRIQEVAPAWAIALKKRQGPHGKSYPPERLAEAWQTKQFDTILTQLHRQSVDEVNADLKELSRRFKEVTVQLTEAKAWGRLIQQLNEKPFLRTALNSWKNAQQKIGKGTGKRAPIYRREAQKAMTECQDAVPAWIMPMQKALETLDPAHNAFDIIIIDEASQSDLSALAVLYMGKKLIIVGDDQQVSPSNVGLKLEDVDHLMASYLNDSIPKANNFHFDNSLYDVAKIYFDQLMLLEHFRCVPDIIGYSNHLSYHHQIKPLRDAHSTHLTPALVPYRVADGYCTKGNVNEEEAQVIVDFIEACIADPAYRGKTMGVISLLGNRQAPRIEEIIYQRIPLEKIEAHQILCGNPAQFQGDERDVIFLSMVDSGDESGPLRLRSEGAGNSTKQRYNVAVSRARDQLFVIHSLDPANDLKEGDMRRGLLEYVYNPEVFARAEEQMKEKADSPFEEAVGRYLIAKRYNFVQQWQAGSYFLDFVIQDGNRKVALECDGELYHSSEEAIRNDMERQAILERIGWTFVRLRGSEFYRDPDAAMERIFEELASHGIHPQKGPAVDGITFEKENTSTPLLERVKQNKLRIQQERQQVIE